MTVAKIQNNEFPGFYSAIAQIDHPIWDARGVANLIRHYAEDDRNAVGSFVVFNKTQKIYERIIIKSKTEDSSCTLMAFRPNSNPVRDSQTMLGEVYFKFKEFEYGPELPNGKKRKCWRISILNIDSHARHLQGLGTLLVQAALEFYPESEGRMELYSSNYPHPHPFYYKLGMRWAERLNREYDPGLYAKAERHVKEILTCTEVLPDDELRDLYARVSKLLNDKTPDYDAIILKEIEDARKAGREASTTHIQEVPRALLLYFPDDAIKVWREIINNRPVLYPRCQQ